MEQFKYVAAKINPREVGIEKISPDHVLQGVLNTAYVMAGLVAVIVIVAAGIIYTTSAGDASKTKQAREAIIYAAVGLVVIMMAFVITNYLLGRFN